MGGGVQQGGRVIMGAYNEGYEAFQRGDLPEMNPYDDRDGQYDEWIEGYMHADCYESGEWEPTKEEG